MKSGAMCTLEVHEERDCKAESARCYHCRQNHKVRDPRCSAQRQEEELCNIQNKEKIPWMAARQKYFA